MIVAILPAFGVVKINVSLREYANQLMLVAIGGGLLFSSANISSAGSEFGDIYSEVYSFADSHGAIDLIEPAAELAIGMGAQGIGQEIGVEDFEVVKKSRLAELQEQLEDAGKEAMENKEDIMDDAKGLVPLPGRLVKGLIECPVRLHSMSSLLFPLAGMVMASFLMFLGAPREDELA